MNRLAVRWIILMAAWAMAEGQVAPFCNTVSGAETAPRQPWTTSRLRGSPEPPPPYQAPRVFPKLQFINPVLIVHEPTLGRYFVAELTGKIFSFPDDQTVERGDLLVDLKTDLLPSAAGATDIEFGNLYGLVFPPDFAANRCCYVCYTLRSKSQGDALPDGTRLSRIRLTGDSPPRVERGSEQLLLTWLAGGHNGGCLVFGPDGCLYVSAGDATAPSPPDMLRAGQDVSNLLSTVFRIDVRAAAGDRPYTIPPDNPFVALPGARPEVWAYGFRNPWKMSFDRATGELWLGDVGWELWELIFRVERGGNYGWSIVEGPQPVNTDWPRGPTPITPAAMALPHSDAASITGGYVYRGRQLPQLVGSYVFGDWETRRIWAAEVRDGALGPRWDIVEPTVRVIAFGETPAGELLVLDYDQGTIHQIVAQTQPAAAAAFPTRLSETGLFGDTPRHEIAAGVIPFAINTPMWSDGATAARFVALPGDSNVVVHAKPVAIPGSMFQRQLDFPADAVLAKTLSLELTPGDESTRRRIETQLLHFDGRAWRAYSYAWNEEQTDAELVPAEGAARELLIADPAAPGGTRRLDWEFAARAVCLRCHNPWSQHTLAFNLTQLNRAAATLGIAAPQIEHLVELGILSSSNETRAAMATAARIHAATPLVDPRDATATLDARARSYLHANCSHCHQQNAGGTAVIDVRRDRPLAETESVRAKPLQGAFGLADAAVVAPGDPYRSVLFLRISKHGPGRMPHVGSQRIDDDGVQLVHDWIAALGDAAANTGAARTDAIAALVHGRADGITEATLNDPHVALQLAHGVASGSVAGAARGQLLAVALRHPSALVRDLFERFMDEAARPRRLGTQIVPARLLSVPGVAERGRSLFGDAAAVQCKTCHRVAGEGSTLGPDLSEVGKRLSPAAILENILEPSKTIDPKYLTYVVETKDGRVLTGVLVERSAAEVVLRDAKDQVVRVPIEDVDQVLPQRVSLMPEQLLRDLTVQEAADLLAFLASLK